MNIHVVQPSDSIYSIAEMYGVSVEKLIQDNELESFSGLVPGQTIVIVYPELTYTVQEGDNLLNIANAHGITVMQLLRNNPFLSDREYLNPGETLVISYNTSRKITTNGFVYPYVNLETLKKTLPYLTYISVFNYSASSNGEVVSYYDDLEIIQLAKEYSTIPLMMMTTLTPQGEPNIELAYNILLDEELQDRHINNILNIISTKGYSGVNMVFNYMNTTNQNLYLNLITKLSNRLMNEGYLTFVTINLNMQNIDNEITFEKIDYSGISQVANGIVFLHFIWGSNFGPPSPVSSINNIRAFVDYVTTTVSPDKIVIGKPLIGYDWELPYIPGRSSANSLTLNSALSLARDVGATIQFDETTQTPFFQYDRYNFGAPVQRIVWAIDARSIDALLKLISEYGLDGAGIWNIMVFYPQLWLLINSQYEIEKYLL
jgi:spore germination protein